MIVTLEAQGQDKVAAVITRDGVEVERFTTKNSGGFIARLDRQMRNAGHGRMGYTSVGGVLKAQVL